MDSARWRVGGGLEGYCARLRGVVFVCGWRVRMHAWSRW